MRVERLQQPGKEAAGSRHGPEVARQTVTAETETIGPPTEMLMEEMLRRENLIAALIGYWQTGAFSACSINFGPGCGPLEPPCTVPYARWCGGTGGATLPPTR